MKALIISTILTFFGLFCNAQLEIEPFPIETKAPIGQLEVVPIPKAKSSCGEVKVIYSDNIFSGGCLGQIVRTYRFTSPCGETATKEQFISITDDIPPAITDMPENATLPKGATPPALPKVGFTDNSNDECEIIWNEVRQGNKIIRTATCTDRCGNVTQASYTLTYR